MVCVFNIAFVSEENVESETDFSKNVEPHMNWRALDRRIMKLELIIPP